MQTSSRATKVLKIALYNILILFFCLLLIEVFFIINSKYKFINPPPSPPEKPTLNIKEAENKYGLSVFSVPDQYKTQFDKLPDHAEIDSGSKEPLWKLLRNQNLPATAHVQLRLLPPHEDIVLYNVEYKIDKYGRRSVENQKDKTKSSQYLLALGDSWTFGEGVTSGQDYPSQLAKKLNSDIKVYNFGKPGFGSNDFLYQLQLDPGILDEVTQKEGMAIWFFIEAQLERFFCDFICYQDKFALFIHKKPHYELIDNKLAYLGPFSESWTFKRKLLYSLAQSEAVKFSGLKFKYSNEQMLALVASFKEMKTILEQKKNLKKFYVLFSHPFKEKEQLTQLLKNEKINVIDISDIPFYEMKTYIPFDRHPTSNYNWIISEILKKYIAP